MIYIKRTAIYLIGFNLLIVGISFLITSTYGQSAWDGVYVAFSKKAQIPVGLATILTASLILVVCYLLTNDWHVFLSLITSLIQSLLIDFYLTLVKNSWPSETPIVRIILFITGIVLMSIGISIYIQAKYPTNHVDCLMLSLARRFSLNLRTSKFVGDSIAIVLTLFIARQIALGTFIVLFSLSPLVQLISDRLAKPINQFIYSRQLI
ncbi:hypothetical protein IGI37_002735 [Enterococcus sp. AZ194]|uniref:YczE/YyaS/YitT family protein n=1 Tax=Enterococcus sp. AZ194 TaxID=2774629 RepID=UPI003F298CBD